MKKYALTLILFSSFLFSHEIHIWDANQYHENSESQKKTSEYILEKFTFNGHENVLDLGCGEGKISAYLASLIPKGKVTGVDLSPQMLAFAEENFPLSKHHNLNFQEGNACFLNFSNQFDIVFSFTALQWAENHEKALRSIRNALKPSGTVAISMPMGFPLSMQQVIDEMTAQSKWRDYYKDFSSGFNFVTLEEYKDLLFKVGFDINLIEKRPQKDLYQNKEALKGFLSQILPYLRPIPPEKKEEFMNQFIDRYLELEEIGEKDMPYFYPTHLIVIAHKR